MKDILKSILFAVGPAVVYAVLENARCKNEWNDLSIIVCADSDEEHKLRDIFRNNGEKFKNLRTNYGNRYGSPENIYRFKLKTKNLNLIDDFLVNF